MPRMGMLLGPMLVVCVGMVAADEQLLLRLRVLGGRLPFTGTLHVAASCNQSDIQSVLDIAQSGDTIEVPEGECTWTGQLTSLDKSLIVRGQGSGPTIFDANNIDTRVMRFDCDADDPQGFLQITRFRFVENVDTELPNNPLLLLNDCARFELAHVTFEGYGGGERSEIIHVNNSFGVIHSNTFGNGPTNWLLVGFTRFKGVGAFGDASWAAPTDWGSIEAVYIEDNDFQNNSTTGFQLIEANGEGARYVARFNTIRHYFLGGHGTESPGRSRGIRKAEVYFNQWHTNPGAQLDRTMQMRSGTLMHHNNTIARWGGGGAPGFNSWVRLWQARLADSLGGWGYCDGTGTYDLNDTTGGPNGDGIYVSGTAGEGTTTDVLVDDTKDFSTACGGGSCIGFSLRNLTRNRSSLITGVSGSQLATRASNFPGQPHNYQSGDSYEIRRVIKCIDHVGTGQSVLLSGDFPNITPAGWPQNQSDPVYVFRNTGGSPTFSVVSNLARLTQDVDFFVGTSNFNGTSGVGSGLRSARPATCSPGVAYWATDGGGNWNTVNETENDGALDWCNAQGQWVNDWYVPLQYPHPWRGQFPPVE